MTTEEKIKRDQFLAGINEGISGGTLKFMEKFHSHVAPNIVREWNENEWPELSVEEKATVANLAKQYNEKVELYEQITDPTVKEQIAKLCLHMLNEIKDQFRNKPGISVY